MLGQGFHGPELEQPLAASGPGRVPELVEADFAAVGVAALIGMEVAQGFADRHPLVARRQTGQHLVGELQVEPGGAALIGPGRLGGGPHRIATE